jgi:pimeloyl-ACP methyl ester carboxylesterase
VHGFLQVPVGPVSRDLAVLICPPFGWDDVCSYRSRRDWADDLATAGYTSLRIDLPGCGDSGGGPLHPDRFGSWVAAAGESAAWLRMHTSAGRVAGIGIGLGGLVLAAAMADGAPIDDLVLWATPARGRNLLRELRAFASLEAGGISPNRARRASLKLVDEQPTLEDGQLEAGGFLMSAETVNALQALDVTKLSIPEAEGREVLLLERDGLPVDARLRRHLEQSGVGVTVAAGDGYGAMMAEPQEARAPTEVFRTVASWLDTRSHPVERAPVEPDLGPAECEPASIDVDGGSVRERPFVIARPDGDLFGILTEAADRPAAGFCAVFLSAGAIHHIGPNRMWVEVARRWAARGVPVLRLDMPAIGDSDGDPRTDDSAARYAGEQIEDVLAVLDALEASGIASRFVLGGLCSGAHWSFQGALRDPRVIAALMLNPAVLFWDPSIPKMRDLREGLHNTSLWRRALRREASLGRALTLLRWSPRALAATLRRMLTRLGAWRSTGDEVDRAFDSLRNADTRILLAFSNREPLHDELIREGRIGRLEQMPNVTLESLPGVYHGLREIAAQAAGHAALDRAMAGLLERFEKNETHRTADPRSAAGR